MILALLSATASLFAASHATDTFSVSNCTSQRIQINFIYSPLVSSRIIDTHTVQIDPLSTTLETTTNLRDPESLLVSFVPSTAGFPLAQRIPVRPVIASGLDVRLVHVGLLIGESGAPVWRRLRQFELSTLDTDTSSTAGLCATLFYHGYGM